MNAGSLCPGFCVLTSVRNADSAYQRMAIKTHKGNSSSNMCMTFGVAYRLSLTNNDKATTRKKGRSIVMEVAMLKKFSTFGPRWPPLYRRESGTTIVIVTLLVQGHVLKLYNL